MKKIVLMAVLAMVAFTVSAKGHGKHHEDEGHIYLSKDKSFYLEPGLLSAGFNFGLNMPEGIDNVNKRSEFVAWDLMNLTKALGSKNNTLSVGFGMIWNKYASSNRCWHRSVYEYVETLDTESFDRSRYLTYALSIPFEYCHKFNNKMFIAAGPVVNFNVFSSIYNEITTGDTKYTERIRKCYQTPVTVDLRCQVGYKDLGLFFKYSPMNVIKKDKGPEFQSFGIGIVVRDL